MLNPNHDRLDYGKLLAPPDGYRLDFAVGTTYSLDLNALVGAALALGLSEETDSELMNNPICLLEALRVTGDKVALFSEDGQIHVPNKVTKLFVLLEKMVYPVETQKGRWDARYPSFHPKFWLIRYLGEYICYRVIVLSRNLTFDRSWDVVFSMDGYVSEKATAKKNREKNEPLCDFLEYLRSFLPATDHANEKNKKIREMIKEVPDVIFSFDKEDKGFEDYAFIPHGVKDTSGNTWAFDETPLFKDSWQEVFVISPFLSNDVIKELNDRKSSHITNYEYTLITRKLSLSSIKPEDADHFDVFVMRDEVIDGENAISEEKTDIRSQDIHAKLYMTRKYGRSDLYLGSFNASHNAVHGNIEFMVHLSNTNRYLNSEKLRLSLFGEDPEGKENPFQRVDLEEFQASENKEANDHHLNEIIKEICRSHPKAVIKEIDGSFDITVNTTWKNTDYTVMLRPLLSNKEQVFEEVVRFTSLDMMRLSEFYVISVSDKEQKVERVIMIPTEGMPDDREKEVVNSVVSNRECFYWYISFLLGADSVIGSMEAIELERIGNSNVRHGTMVAPALYEKMLRAAADDAERLDGIDFLLKSINQDGVIPKEFEKLYRTVIEAVKMNG